MRSALRYWRVESRQSTRLTRRSARAVGLVDTHTSLRPLAQVFERRCPARRGLPDQHSTRVGAALRALDAHLPVGVPVDLEPVVLPAGTPAVGGELDVGGDGVAADRDVGGAHLADPRPEVLVAVPAPGVVAGPLGQHGPPALEIAGQRGVV